MYMYTGVCIYHANKCCPLKGLYLPKTYLPISSFVSMEICHAITNHFTRVDLAVLMEILPVAVHISSFYALCMYAQFFQLQIGSSYDEERIPYFVGV